MNLEKAKVRATANKLKKHTATIRGQRVAGHVQYRDDGDTAYVWTQSAWCASMTITRGDMTQADFRAMVAAIAAVAKAKAA